MILSPPTALYGDAKEICKLHADVPYTNLVMLAVHITACCNKNISFRISFLSSTEPVARYFPTALHIALSHGTLERYIFSQNFSAIPPHDTDVLSKITANEHFSHALTTFCLRMTKKNKLGRRIK